MTNPQLLSTWIPIAVIAAVMTWRARHVGRDRRFDLSRVWILPVVVAVVIAAALMAHPPVWQGWLALALGAALGVLLGWQRGRLTHIGLHPETGEVMVRHSAAAMLLMVGVVVLRQYARFRLAELGPGHGDMLLLASDAMMGLAGGAVITFRAELWLRAKRILASSPQL